MIELERGLHIQQRSESLLADIGKLKEAKAALTAHLAQLGAMPTVRVQPCVSSHGCVASVTRVQPCVCDKSDTCV